MATRVRFLPSEVPKNDLRALIQDLGTENIRLQCTLRVLLSGAVPDENIEKLIENPFGPEWIEYDDSLRARLWMSSEIFRDCVEEMGRAAQELQDKLCLKDGHHLRLTTHQSILQKLKFDSTFSLKKIDYESIVSRLKAGNTALVDFVRHGRRVEADVQLRSQNKTIKILRQLSRSVFNALKGASVCNCVNSHHVCLELVVRKELITPKDSDIDAEKRFSFHIVLGSYGTSLNQISLEKMRKSGLLEHIIRWESLCVRLADIQNREPNVTSQPYPTATSFDLVRPPKAKRVKWFHRDDKEMSVDSTIGPLVVTSSGVALSQISALQAPKLTANLCHAVFRRQKDSYVDCYGYIADSERLLGLHQMENQPGFRSAVTLRQVLEWEEQGTLQFRFDERINIALTIALSVLHLYSTPWIAKVMTLDDILFLWQDGQDEPVPSNASSRFQPFVSKHLLESANVGPPTMLGTKRPINTTVLSLGALLVQLIFGEIISDIEMNEEGGINSILSKHKAAASRRDRIREVGGENYEGAVMWCFESAFKIAGLENEDFCQKFYAAVVAPLEKDAEDLKFLAELEDC